jgi:endonuclease/exonuclease/phosphatase family metal-dependent hydrolase
MNLKRAGIWSIFLLFCTSVWATPLSAQTPIADGEPITVMTYNIKHARGNDDCVNPTPEEGTVPESECEIDLQRIADVIDASGASVIGLQEVDRFWARSGGVDQPEELASLLDMHVCYGANLDHEADDHVEEPHQYGTAVLSVYPIVNCENTFLPSTEGWEQRGALQATIELDNGQQVLVINTHLQAGREGEQEEAVRQRTQQLQGVLDIAAASDLPTIITGDLNADPGSTEMAAIEDPGSGFSDAWAVANPGEDGFTIPASPDEPADARIDYIWVDASITVVSAEVIVNDPTLLAADHLPVIATLLVNGGPATPEAPPIATPIT